MGVWAKMLSMGAEQAGRQMDSTDDICRLLEFDRRNRDDGERQEDETRRRVVDRNTRRGEEVGRG